MTDISKNPNPAKTDELDRTLDTALAKYAAVEPRTGLEDRILANLRAERSRATERGWWKWGVAATVAVVIVVGIALAWRPARHTSPVVTNHPAVAASPAPPVQMANRSRDANRWQRTRVRKASVRRSSPEAVVADDPKLDQFPSPEPLTEEELMLVRYVQQFPAEAITVAQAQEELEKELQRKLGRDTRSSDSDQQER